MAAENREDANSAGGAAASAGSREVELLFAAAVPLILPFLEFSDLLPLALTTKASRQHVDHRCDILVKRVLERHGVAAPFLTRVAERLQSRRVRRRDAAPFLARVAWRLWSRRARERSYSTLPAGEALPPRCQLSAVTSAPLYRFRPVLDAARVEDFLRQQLPRRRSRARLSPVSKVEIFPSGTRLAVVSDLGDLEVWNLATRQRECTIHPSILRNNSHQWLDTIIFPAEDRIAIICKAVPGSEQDVVEVWNLPTGENLAAFPVGSEYHPDYLLFGDSQFIFYSWDTIRVWTESAVAGKWVNDLTYREPNMFLQKWAQISKYELLLVSSYRPYNPVGVCHVKLLDLRTGTATARFAFDLREEFRNAEEVGCTQLLVCSRKWVVVLVHEYLDDQPRPGGIYVFDLHTNQKVHFLQGCDCWSSMHQAADCKNTICVSSISGNCVHALHFDTHNGRLSVRCSLWLEDVEPDVEVSILDVFRNRIYVSVGGKCGVYNIETREREHSWSFGEDCSRTLVSRSRNELLCLERGESIASFCLDEPILQV